MLFVAYNKKREGDNMAIFPYRFSSDPSLKPKPSNNKKKEGKQMACGSGKKKSTKSTAKKCGKKGCK